MRDDPIMRLAAANPVPHDGPLRALDAHGNGRRRRRIALGIVVAAGVIAVVLVATPAWALVHDVLPFSDQPSAPPSVVKDYFSWSNQDDPPNTPLPEMSPQADLANVRAVMEAEFGGKTHTLYVSPAKNSRFEFCSAWSDVGFSSCLHAWADQSGPMGIYPDIVYPHDASQPAQPITVMMTPGEPVDVHRREHGVPDWLTGEVASPTVASVVIRFSDGTTAQPEITFVSDPINAGFFAYQVPNDMQSATNHVTEVDAYDSNGNRIERQPMAPMAPPTGSATTER